MKLNVHAYLDNSAYGNFQTAKIIKIVNSLTLNNLNILLLALIFNTYIFIFY